MAGPPLAWTVMAFMLAVFGETTLLQLLLRAEHVATPTDAGSLAPDSFADLLVLSVEDHGSHAEVVVVVKDLLWCG